MQFHNKGVVEISDREKLARLLNMLVNLIKGEKNWLANTANASALLFQELDRINWAGFYFIQGEELILGPFQGLPACVRIKIGKGICGSAVRDRKTYVVKDVHQFKGHIACDSSSNSEIVIPLFKNNKIIGVMDIDSPVKNRFDKQNQESLEQFAEKLVTGSVFPGYFGGV